MVRILYQVRRRYVMRKKIWMYEFPTVFLFIELLTGGKEIHWILMVLFVFLLCISDLEINLPFSIWLRKGGQLIPKTMNKKRKVVQLPKSSLPHVVCVIFSNIFKVSMLAIIDSTNNHKLSFIYNRYQLFWSSIIFTLLMRTEIK